MRFRLIAVLCLLFAVNALAQEKAQPGKLGMIPNPEAYVARSHKVWEDFRTRNKAALAATLADGFQALEEGGNSFFDAKQYLSTVDEFELKSYTLSDYMVVPLAAGSVLVHYHAVYEGVTGTETTQANAGFSEVWVRRGNSWKLQYLQETYFR